MSLSLSPPWKRRLRRFGIVLALLVVASFAFAKCVTSIIWRQREEAHAPPALNGAKANAAVATAHPLATDAAREVLAEHGTAVDAAIAAALTLAVVEPQSAGLGGGGFALVYDPRANASTSLDFRERAPHALNVSALLDAARRDSGVLRQGALSVAVPEDWAGLVALHEKYGKLPMSRLARRAIAIARDGFEVSGAYTLKCMFRLGALRADAGSRAIYLGSLGLCPRGGATLRQPALADTLAALTDDAHPVSWADRVGRPMVEYLKKLGSAADLQDLTDAKPLERPVVTGSFHGMKVVSMGPPSSGGLIVVSWLQTYERARERLPQSDWTHLWIESSRLAYFDRAELMGDPDFVDVPSARLTSREYADAQAGRLSPTTELALVAAHPPGADGPHTTHVSVVDADGEAIALTMSINLPFGSGLTVPGTGVLLNDEMDDFYTNQENAFHLVGNERNAPGPGKRPLSSMAPTMVFDDKGLYLVVGSPGGSYIPTAVANVIRDLVEDHMDPGAAVHAARMHHQWSPNRLELEPRFEQPLPGDVQKSASRSRFPMGDVQMIVRTDQGWRGVSDCRGEGLPWSGVAPPP